MKEKLDPMTLFESKAESFCDILNIIRTAKNTGVRAVYFRCVEWNTEAPVKLWFKIINKTKMQAYRVMNGKMVRLDGFHPDFRMTIADMFKPFEYIIER
jgi:hypothetical protein